MKTALVYIALAILGFLPVLLVLSVWDDDEPQAAAPLDPEEQARRAGHMQNFIINREGCELARHQVQRELAKHNRKVSIGLELCQVEHAAEGPEWIARGQAKFLGAQRWDPPVGFAVWFVKTPAGPYAPCAVHLAGRSRRPVKHAHRACVDWSGRG